MAPFNRDNINPALRKKTAQSTTKPSSDNAGMSDVTSDPNKKDTKKTNFESKFSNLEGDFNEHFEFSTKAGVDEELTDALELAINGQYKYMIQQKGKYKSGFQKDAWEDVGLKAWNIGAYIKSNSQRGFKNEEEANAYNQKLGQLKSEFSELFSIAKTSLYFNEEGKQRTDDDVKIYYNKDTHRLETAEYHKKNSLSKIVRFSDDPSEILAGTNIQANLTYSVGLASVRLQWEEKERPKAAYTNIAMNERVNRRMVNNKVHPVVKEWGLQGFNQWGKGSSETAILNNKENIVDLFKYQLEWLSKYGSASDGKLKDESSQMLKDLEKLSVDGVYDYVQKNRSKYRNMVDNLGYFGTVNAYKKFKNRFNQPSYYPGSTIDEKKKNFKESQTVLSTMIRKNDEFNEVRTTIRKSAYDHLKNKSFSGSPGNESQDMERMIFDYLINANGDVRGFDKVRHDLHKKGGTYLKDGVRYWNPHYYKQIASEVWRSTESEQGIHIGASESGGGGKWVTEYRNNPGYSYNELKDAYKRVVDKFKKQFGKEDVQNTFEQTSMLSGLGYKRSQFIGYDAIDLTADNTKTSDIKNILSIVESQNWDNNIFGDKVFIQPGGYTKGISYNILKKIGDSGQGGTNEQRQKKIFDEFFKDGYNKDNPQLYDMDFSRETGLPGKSSYTFRKRGKKPKMVKTILGEVDMNSITIYVDKELANSKGESFIRNTYTSPYDWSFNMDGEWDMSWAAGDKSKGDLKIVYDPNTGNKILQGHLWDPVIKDYTDVDGFVLGNNDMVDINMAEQTVKDILARISNPTKEELTNLMNQ